MSSMKQPKIIVQLQDDLYQDTHSQIDLASRQRNNWGNWYWGKDSKNKLYFKGMISGYSSKDRWTSISSICPPLNEQDIIRLRDFIIS